MQTGARLRQIDAKKDSKHGKGKSFPTFECKQSLHLSKLFRKDKKKDHSKEDVVINVINNKSGLVFLPQDRHFFCWLSGMTYSFFTI